MWAEQYDKSDTDSKEEGENVYDEMVTHEQIQQMFSGESDDDEFFLFWINIDDSSASYSITSFDAQSSAADTAASADNAEIEAAADAIIDFTEGNPFGSL